LRQFIEDIRAKIGVVEIFEKTTKIRINGIPFVPVKQEILDDLRKNGGYDRYFNKIKELINKEVNKVVAERKTSFNIEEICSSGEMADNW